MSIAKVIEISSTSPQSFEDAVSRGIERAGKTVENISGAWIKEQTVRIDKGKIIEYKVNMLVTFILK